MSRKKQQQNETMTPMQHRAVLVCILCVLAVLLMGVWGSGFSEASFIYFNF